MENFNEEITKDSTQTAAPIDIKDKIRREQDSLDDFEHLEHITKDTEKLIDTGDSSDIPRAQVNDLVSDAPINNVAASGTAFDAGDELLMSKENIEEKQASENIKAMEMNIDELNLPSSEYSKKPDYLDNVDTDDIVISGLTPTDLIKNYQNSESTEQIDSLLNGLKATTQNLLDYERGASDHSHESNKIQPSFNDLADKFTDSDPDLDIDEDRYLHDDHKAKFASADDLLRADSPTALPSDQFKDVLHEHDSDDMFSSPTPNEEILSAPIQPSMVPSAPPAEIPVKGYMIEPDEPIREFIQDDYIEPVKQPEPVKQSEPVKQTVTKASIEKKSSIELSKPSTSTAKKPEVGIMQAEEMFLKMGLDTWFNPERLHPTVESLIYWRDPKKSGAVFGSILVVLLSLAYFSLISVTAYISLIVLVGTICFRIYKNIMQAVQKTSDGHPFKEFLELDLTLPQDKVKEVTELVVAHINGGVNELRRLFLVEDLIDSIKFGVLLWCLTYLGAWFNGMTLIIIGFVALFTLPKVYETNKTQIDANLDIVRTKLAEITSKVKAAVPIGKKSEEKKEQ